MFQEQQSEFSNSATFVVKKTFLELAVNQSEDVNDSDTPRRCRAFSDPGPLNTNSDDQAVFAWESGEVEFELTGLSDSDVHSDFASVSQRHGPGIYSAQTTSGDDEGSWSADSFTPRSSPFTGGSEKEETQTEISEYGGNAPVDVSALLSQNARLQLENQLLRENARLLAENTSFRARMQEACTAGPTTVQQTVHLSESHDKPAVPPGVWWVPSGLDSYETSVHQAWGSVQMSPMGGGLFESVQVSGFDSSRRRRRRLAPKEEQHDDQSPPSDGDTRTTVMLRNLPNNYGREALVDMLDGEGFAGMYDFVYLPIDFKTQACLGYAFVNLTTPSAVGLFWETFDGYSKWSLPSKKVCRVTWDGPHQGRDAQIKRYRNSPIMHASVPEEYKPLVLQAGQRVPFPEPTKAPRPPRTRC